MTVMVWDDSLDVGVEAMNSEHKGLLDLMNALHDAASSGVDASRTIQLLDRLERATVDHFAHEERHMERIGFPEIERHKLIHADLLSKFAGHAALIRETREVPDTFFDFLRYWLSAHIKGIDVKYGRFEKESGGAQRAAG